MGAPLRQLRCSSPLRRCARAPAQNCSFEEEQSARLPVVEEAIAELKARHHLVPRDIELAAAGADAERLARYSQLIATTSLPSSAPPSEAAEAASAGAGAGAALLPHALRALLAEPRVRKLAATVRELHTQGRVLEAQATAATLRAQLLARAPAAVAAAAAQQQQQQQQQPVEVAAQLLEHAAVELGLELGRLRAEAELVTDALRQLEDDDGWMVSSGARAGAARAAARARARAAWRRRPQPVCGAGAQPCSWRLHSVHAPPPPSPLPGLQGRPRRPAHAVPPQQRDHGAQPEVRGGLTVSAASTNNSSHCGLSLGHLPALLPLSTPIQAHHHTHHHPPTPTTHPPTPLPLWPGSRPPLTTRWSTCWWAGGGRGREGAASTSRLCGWVDGVGVVGGGRGGGGWVGGVGWG